MPISSIQSGLHATCLEVLAIGDVPFENLSADTSLAYMANGLTTDLIDELAQIRALTVVSKNGTLPFRGKAIGVDSIARTLNVGSVITGDVRKTATDADPVFHRNWELAKDWSEQSRYHHAV